MVGDLPLGSPLLVAEDCPLVHLLNAFLEGNAHLALVVPRVGNHSTHPPTHSPSKLLNALQEGNAHLHPPTARHRSSLLP